MKLTDLINIPRQKWAVARLRKSEKLAYLDDPDVTIHYVSVKNDENAPHGVNTQEEMSHTDADPITD